MNLDPDVPLFGGSHEISIWAAQLLEHVEVCRAEEVDLVLRLEAFDSALAREVIVALEGRTMAGIISIFGVHVDLVEGD